MELLEYGLRFGGDFFTSKIIIIPGDKQNIEKKNTS